MTDERKYESRDDLIHMKFLKEGSKLHEQLIGLFAFLFTFLIVIPVWLYKKKHFTTLEAYMPNVNLIAKEEIKVKNYEEVVCIKNME